MSNKSLNLIATDEWVQFALFEDDRLVAIYGGSTQLGLSGTNIKRRLPWLFPGAQAYSHINRNEVFASVTGIESFEPLEEVTYKMDCLPVTLVDFS